MPVTLVQPISERAAALARQNIRDRGWSERAAAAVVPIAREGQAALRVNLDYLLYQERGIRPFVMYWVEGKKVPIKDASGTHVVTGRNPGQPGWVTLPGGVKKWRDQRWKHPGLPAQRFLEHSLQQAIREAQPTLGQRLKNFLFRKGEFVTYTVEG